MGAARSFATTILLVSMVVPLQLRAQHNYVFTQVPTLGGPNIYANQTGAKNNLLNAVGALTGGADTSVTDQLCSNDPHDCSAEHAFIFRNRTLIDLGALPDGFNSTSILDQR
jgi:hypothetical protein